MNTNWRNLLIGISVVGCIGGYLYDKAGNYESESWTEYEDDRYTVSFPTSETPQGLPGDYLTGMTVIWRNHAYTAGWMPEEKQNKQAPDESLMEGLTGLAEESSVVKSSKMHTYEGLSAFDLELAAKSDGSGKIERYLCKGDRIYLLWVTAYEGESLDPSSPEIEKFLASFHAR